MMKLWIDVVGGGDDERVVATGGLKEIEEALDQYEHEVENDSDKYWEIETDDKDIVFNSKEDYYSTVKREIAPQTMAQYLGSIFLRPDF